MKRIQSPRDVVIMSDGAQCLVMAVDSCGGIGEKAGDALHCAPETVGLFAARVALLEVLATGAVPIAASIGVCNDAETAEKLMEGVHQAFALCGNPEWVISTEKNMQTNMTALCVSVTGICPAETLRIGMSRSGDLLCLAGLPLVGPEIVSPGAEIFKLEQMAALLGEPLVGSILPVGSKGIAAEAGVLARESGLTAYLDPACGVDTNKSAGPSACVLFSARPGIKNALTFPFRVIGRLN
jgi:hypothetical protein